LKAKEPEKLTRVPLDKLFSPPRDGVDAAQQILIKGRAGAGKTTLCQMIIHDFYHDDPWKWKALFDRILWLPLRKLKGRQVAGYNLESLIFDEYLSQVEKGKLLAHEVFSEIERTSGKRTLFILDGLDEVYQDFDSRAPMAEFFQHLLNQTNVIITTRPHDTVPRGLEAWLDAPKFELEIIALDSEQVQAYVNHIFQSDPDKARSIKDFLQGHELMESLIQIPIQLDILCYIWEKNVSKDSITTMTGLYEAIELRMWKKHILKREKSTNATELKDLDRFQLKSWVESEIHFVELPAFLGLYNNISDFGTQQRVKIERIAPLQPGRSLDSILAKLSFLRTSDGSGQRVYDFLHTTFQESFAAQYFIRKFVKGETLECLLLGEGSNKKLVDTAQFIEEEKYNPRYEIFWRFVTDLLQLEGNKDKLELFFKKIDAEPRDLLGPAHQRLVMRCFGEIVPGKLPDYSDRRSYMEFELFRWVSVELRAFRDSRLTEELEFRNKCCHACCGIHTLVLNMIS
jgi:NACHT, LRR and PYD domains-containing protein 3